MQRLGLKRGLLALAALIAVSALGQITSRTDAVGKLLSQWSEASSAAGLGEIYYENRDGQHSPLNTSQYPQLRIFQPDAKSGPPTGPAVALRPHPTVGNCSMSAPAEKGGSLPRMYQMDPKGQQFLMMQYLSNNLILYPEHQDYDVGGNGVGGYGDLYPSNNACTLISQGSSFSDQPFLNAVLSTIAAFPPETQRLLIEKRILMPTVQSIFRQSNQQVKKEEDYFTAAAHPVVFDAAQLNEEKMVSKAQEMRPPQIPPMVQLSVIEESKLTAGKDYFETAQVVPYQLADTPVSIARIMRGQTADYEMVVSSQKSADVMGRPVTMRWQVLQGDPDLVKLEKLEEPSQTRVKVRWQPPVKTATGIRSHRVDIGVFASNGITTSAPAILSFYMLPNEMHFYDAQGRVTEVCFQAHNPELGLPDSDRDPRWLKAMFAVSVAGDGLRSRLMEKLLTEPERLAIQKVWMPLSEQLQIIAKMETDPTRKDSVEARKNKLSEEIEKALQKPLPGERSFTVKTAIEHALTSVIELSDLFLTFQKEFMALAAKSPKTSAAGDLANELKRLKELNVLMEEASGFISTSSPPDNLTAADRYYLRGLSLTLLSQVLFPEVLERSTAPAWVDPRLTTAKPWRDVHRYDEDGKHLGWIRHQDSRTTWFSPEGQLLPEGPKQASKAQTVIYEKNAQGLLEWRAQ